MRAIFAFLLFLILCTNTNSTLKMKPLTLFPFPPNTKSELEISPKIETEKISTSDFDTMVIRIIKKNQVIEECAKFTYGMLKFIDNTFKGEFMEIPLWNRNENSIKINIIFKKKSNGKLFEIFILETAPLEKCEQIILNRQKTKFFNSTKIDLGIIMKLDLRVESLKRKTNELLVGETVEATCRAYGDAKNSNPIFLNHREFQIKSSELIPSKNERKLWFQVSLSDHKKVLKCKIKETVQSYKIFVQHSPTKILIEPKNLDYIIPGSKIKCSTNSGYPEPKINWLLISGPDNFTRFYSVINNGTTLKLNSGYKTNVQLEFQCSAENFIRGIKVSIKKVISFKLQNSFPQQCNISDLNFRLRDLENSFALREHATNTTLTLFQIDLKSIKDFQNHSGLSDILKISEDFKKLNLKSISSTTLLEKRINSSEQRIYRTFTEINRDLKNSNTMLKKKLNEQFNDIKFLKNLFDNLEKLVKNNNKDNEIKELENSVGIIKSNIVEIQNKHKQEIKKLENEVKSYKKFIEDSLKVLKFHNEIRTTTFNPVEVGPSSQPNQYYFKWVVDKISSKRMNYQNLESSDYLLDESQVVTIRIEFQELSTYNLLEDIEIYFSFRNKKSPNSSTTKVRIAIEIFNTKWKMQHGKSLIKIFPVKLDYGTSPVFYFNYEDLRKIGVLQSDSITISCTLNYIV